MNEAGLAIRALQEQDESVPFSLAVRGARIAYNVRQGILTPSEAMTALQAATDHYAITTQQP